MRLRLFRHVSLPRPDSMRGRWPVALHMELYDVRICPHCCHLVSGRHGQHGAQRYHENIEEALEGAPELRDPGGYVLPDQMPSAMTGARPADDEDQDVR